MPGFLVGGFPLGNWMGFSGSEKSLEFKRLSFERIGRNEKNKRSL